MPLSRSRGPARRRQRTASSRALAAVLAAALTPVVGCQVAPQPQQQVAAAEDVLYATPDELSASLAEDGGLLLVEFCVPHGCPRCDQMREPINQLAQDQAGRFTVRRINLSRQPELAWEFGLTTCPSYLAFHDGVEVLRAGYPTSAALLASSLEDSLGRVASESGSLAAQ